MQIMWSVIWLLFINNPFSPFSIPIFWNGDLRWQPIFTTEVVFQYQFIFSMFVLASIFVGILEFVFGGKHLLYNFLEDIVSFAQLWVIRDIPKNAFAFSPDILNRYFPVFHVIITILLFIVLISLGVKCFNLWWQGEEKNKSD